MANKLITVDIPREKSFPCECGASFETAAEFSDHVHDEHMGDNDGY